MIGIMVFNTTGTFNNISVISWRSVLFVGETRAHGENHRQASMSLTNLSHNVILSTPHHE